MDIANKDLQRVEVEILSVVCKTLGQHGIVPFLVAGNCLGMVRHGGFIPWDDDIDIGLLRADYEKARKILIEELPEGYRYCDRYTDKEYPYNFAKVKKNNTAFVHGGDAHLDIHHGIYIDIFPYDSAVEDTEEFRKTYKKAKSLRRKIDFKCMSYKKYGKLRPLVQLPIIMLYHLFVNKDVVQNQLDELVSKNVEGNNKYICNYFGLYGEKERYKAEVFGEGKPVTFEGIDCLIPIDYDTYLTQTYGDYMKLPPEEKRVSHHDAIYISLTREYCKRKDN